MRDFVSFQSNRSYLISRDDHRFYLSENTQIRVATPCTSANETLFVTFFFGFNRLLALKGPYIIIIIVIFVCRSKIIDHKEIPSSILDMGSTLPFISYLVTYLYY